MDHLKHSTQSPPKWRLQLTVGVSSRTSTSILSYGRLPIWMPVRLVTKWTPIASALRVPNLLISLTLMPNWRQISRDLGDKACALGASNLLGYLSITRDLTTKIQSKYRSGVRIVTDLLALKAYALLKVLLALLRRSGLGHLSSPAHHDLRSRGNAPSEVPWSKPYNDNTEDISMRRFETISIIERITESKEDFEQFSEKRGNLHELILARQDKRHLQAPWPCVARWGILHTERGSGKEKGTAPRICTGGEVGSGAWKWKWKWRVGD